MAFSRKTQIVALGALVFNFISGCASAPPQAPVEREPAAAPKSFLVGHPYLFHAGQRKDLAGDIAAHTVPLEAWDKYIMGNQTNFDLPPYRRGLYGAETLAGTSLYSAYDFLAGEEPWAIMIKIKAACLTPDAGSGADYDLPVKPSTPSTAFSIWYGENRARYRQLERACLVDGAHYRSWEEGAAYSVSTANPKDVELTQKCTSVLQDFLDERHIKIVSDVENEDSWYLRDRDCIEDVVGSPDELFDLIAYNRIGEPGDPFDANFFGSGQTESAPVGNLFLFLQVLAETTHLHVGALEPLRAIEADVLPKEYREHVRPGVSFRLDRRDDVAEIALRLIRATEGAIQKNQVADFQACLSLWLSESRTALGQACQGKRGVTSAHEQACGDATERQSKTLMKILYAYILRGSAG